MAQVAPKKILPSPGYSQPSARSNVQIQCELGNDADRFHEQRWYADEGFGTHHVLHGAVDAEALDVAVQEVLKHAVHVRYVLIWRTR